MVHCVDAQLPQRDCCSVRQLWPKVEEDILQTLYNMHVCLSSTTVTQ